MSDRPILMGAAGLLMLCGCPTPDPDYVDPLEERVAELEQRVEDQAAQIAVLQAGTTPPPTDPTPPTTGDLQDRLDALEADRLHLVDADLTLQVPSAYADVDAALDWLSDKTIAHGVTVTIQLEPGVYAHSAPIVLDHANGDHLQIVGDPANPGLTVLEFADSDGIVVSNRQALGALEGLTVRGSAAASGTYVGLWVEYGGVLVASDVAVEDFTGDCVYAYWGGLVVLEGGSEARDCGGHGLHAQGAAAIHASGAVVSDNGSNGVVADLRGLVHFGSGTSSGHAFGIWATKGSSVLASSAVLTGNDSAVVAQMGSLVNAESVDFTSSGTYGLHAFYDSFIIGHNSTGDAGDYAYYADRGASISASGGLGTGILGQTLPPATSQYQGAVYVVP